MQRPSGRKEWQIPEDTALPIDPWVCTLGEAVDAHKSYLAASPNMRNFSNILGNFIHKK
jgi:hypothetical protein